MAFNAILSCVQARLCKGHTHQYIHTISDSHAALKALEKFKDTSRIV